MTASFADHEIWHVLLDTDDMKRMNVEQLDDAFRLSLVDASTMVWKAGMKTWQRLGSVAGIDAEPQASVSPPPPPRPIARAAPRLPSRLPLSPHTAVTPAFQTQLLVAPVFAPTRHAPDPYLLPKHRLTIASEVDFRRASGGVRWGRWSFVFLLLTGGLLGAYRQNLLRGVAHELGVEGRYLTGERRLTAFVTSQAPTGLRNTLTRLALLPGPNAAPRPAPLAAVPRLAPASAAANSEPEVKTVSVDSLPLLGAEAQPAQAPASTPAERSLPSAAERTPKSTPRPVHGAAKLEQAAKSTPSAGAGAAQSKQAAATEPAAQLKTEPPPPANESFLKAAIRSAIAADNAKKK